MQKRFVTVGGHKISYIEAGDSGSQLVLLHGLGASAERWEFVIPAFAKSYKVLVPDLIGFGYSDKPMVDYTPEFLAEFLGEFLDTLGITGPNVVGSSMGGQVAIGLASARRDYIRKLVLVSPSGVMKHSTPALDAYIGAALFPNVENASMAFATMEGSGRKADPRIVRRFLKLMSLPNAKMAFMSALLGLKNAKPIEHMLSDISVRTLIIWGSEDPLIPIRHSDTFVTLIKNSEFRRMDNCGHTPYVQYPDRFARIVLDFLSDSKI